MKSETKRWFHIDVLNGIRNRDKHYNKSKQSVKEIDKGNFKYAKLSLKKLLIGRKTVTLRKEFQKIRTILKENLKIPKYAF